MGKAWLMRPRPVASLTASSEVAGAPASNALNDHAGMVWRSAGGAATATLTIDMGVAVALDAMLFFGCTGASTDWTLRIRSADDAGFTLNVATHTSGGSFLAGSAFPSHGRGVGYWEAAGEITARRYWEVQIGALGNAAVSVGRLVAGKRTRLARNFAFGGGFGTRDLGKVEFSSRGVRLRQRAAKLRTVGLTFPAVTKQEAESTILPLLDQIAGQEPLALVTDPDADPMRQRRCYFGHLLGDLGTIWRSSAGWEWRANLVDLIPISAGEIFLANEAVAAPTPPADTTPDAFTFTDQTDVAVGSARTSNTITVAGLSTGSSVAVTVSGGTYSKNGGAASSVSTTAQNGDTFAVSHTASASNSTATNTTLTIGGVGDTFTSTTAAATATDTAPDAFVFADQTGVPISTIRTSNVITVGGMSAGASAGASITGGTYSKNGGEFVSASGTAVNGDTFVVRHTSSAANSTAITTALTIGGATDTFASTTESATASDDPNFGNVIFLHGYNKAKTDAAWATEESAAARPGTTSSADLAINTTALTGAASLHRTSFTATPLTYANHADFHLGAGMFTQEVTHSFDAVPPVDTTNFHWLYGLFDTGANQRSYGLLYYNGGLEFRVSSDGTGTTAVVKLRHVFTPVAGQTYRSAVSFDGTTYRLFLDGVVVASATGAVTLHNSTAAFAVGSALNNGATNGGIVGKIDELRITKGVARYTANYTPSTAEFPRAGSGGTVIALSPANNTPTATTIRLSDGKFINARDFTSQHVQSSLTKLANFIVAARYINNWEEIVTVAAEDAAGSGTWWGTSFGSRSDGSGTGLFSGDRITLRNLVMGMAMPSANDASQVLARHVAKTFLGATDANAESLYRQKMQDVVAEIGLTQTVFANVAGWDPINGEPTHYSTTRDMALLSRHLVANRTRYEPWLTAWNTATFNAPVQNSSGANITLACNHSVAYINGQQASNPDIRGAKSGTNGAGDKRALATEWEFQGARYCTVTLASPTAADRLADHRQVIEHAKAVIDPTYVLGSATEPAGVASLSWETDAQLRTGIQSGTWNSEVAAGLTGGSAADRANNAASESDGIHASDAGGGKLRFQVTNISGFVAKLLWNRNAGEVRQGWTFAVSQDPTTHPMTSALTNPKALNIGFVREQDALTDKRVVQVVCSEIPTGYNWLECTAVQFKQMRFMLGFTQ